MKRLTTIFTVLIAFSVSSGAQNTVEKNAQEKVYTKISDNIYSLTVKDSEGFIIKTGEYFKQDNELLPHGIWTLYSHKSTDVLTKIKYEKGDKMWLETKVDGKFVRMSKDEIAIHRLETRIALLEKKIQKEN